MNKHTPDVVLLIAIAVLIILFAGEPDLMDTIIARLNKSA